MKRASARAMAAAVLLLTALAGAAQAAEPCCTITAIDKQTGVVTAVVKQTGRQFQFEAPNAQTLAGLKVGQGVYANLRSQQVSLDGKKACCRIIMASARERATARGGTGGARRAAEDTEATAETKAPAAEPAGETGEAEATAQQPSARPAPSEAEAAKMQEGEDEDDGEPADPEPAARAGVPMPKGLTGKSSGKDTKKLNEMSYAQKILEEVERGLKDREIDVALIRGQKYMINKCLGVKASTGTFKLKLANPDLRMDGSGVKLTLNIPRISMNALKVRVRPNTNLMKNPCSFSKRHKVGGAATDVRLVMRFDPVVDLKQCKLGSVGKPEIKWRIGGLNLKPLQNDLDRIAKNMIEDSLTYASNFQMMDRMTAAFNAAIGAQCEQ